MVSGAGESLVHIYLHTWEAKNEHEVETAVKSPGPLQVTHFISEIYFLHPFQTSPRLRSKMFKCASPWGGDLQSVHKKVAYLFYIICLNFWANISIYKVQNSI